MTAVTSIYAPMSSFATVLLSAIPATVAPDGSEVRKLPGLPGSSIAHFELAAGNVAHAVMHRTVSEVWFVVSGRGEMWRSQNGREETVFMEPGVCLTVPVGTSFQFRASAGEAVAAVGFTMPPWPGEGEAILVTGPWATSSP